MFEKLEDLKIEKLSSVTNCPAGTIGRQKDEWEFESVSSERLVFLAVKFQE